MLTKLVIKTITLIILLYSITNIMYAQKSILEKEIKIGFNNLTIVDAVSVLNDKLGGIISYKVDIFPKTKRVTLKEQTRKVEEILDNILRGTAIKYILYDNQIILSKSKIPIKVSIGGTITNAATGEVLIGANIIIKELNVGGSTNQYGFYSITIPAGTYTILCSYLGYTSKILEEQHIIEDEKINFDLSPTVFDIDEIIVETESADFNLRSMDMGSFEITPARVKDVPILLGEQDILRSVHLMPGVSSTSEGQSGFFVRGGAVDQNQILLDEAPVYNASHLMGFFSIFNSDAIKSAKLIKGNSSAEYGGKLSSVFDVKMNEGNKKSYNIYGGIGLISSRLTVEGPIVEDKASFIISGRRTYIDIFLPFFADNSLNDGKLYFYDLNAKANIILGENDRLYLSGYFGRDVALFTDQFGIDWGNKTGTLRWNHIFDNRLFSNTTLLYSNYNFGISIKDNESMTDISSGIKDINIKTDFQYYYDTKNIIKFGFNAIHHSFAPGEIKPNDLNSMLIPKTIKNMYALEGAAYLAHEFRISNNLKIDYGLRVSSFSIMGPGEFYNYDDEGEVVDTMFLAKGKIEKTYVGLEPRFTANYMIDESSSLKLSYARNRQYLHLLTNSTSGTPIDRWQPSTLIIQPEIADQFSIGYFKNLVKNKYEFSVEFYYKNLNNQVDYKNGANIILNEYVEADLVFGKGKAYGMELFLKKNVGNFSGWISYTLSRVEKKFAEINDGNMFPAKQDKTHDISIVALYNLNNTWTFSATWVYSTGNAVTFPSGKYNMDGMTVGYYTERNGYRMSAYHRMDLGSTYHISEKSSLTFSLYNAYGRANAYSISFRENKDNPMNTEAVKLSLFSFVPSITYNFRF